MFAIKDWSKSLGQPGASLRAAQEPSGRTVQRSKSVRHWDFLFRPQKKSLFFGLVRGFSLLSVAAMQWVIGTVGCIRSCCTWNWRDKLIGRTFIIRDALWIVGHGRSITT